MPTFDLAATLRGLASRNPGRSEADIQATVREILVYGGFDLGDESVALESPAEDHRRLDVAVGAVIIECKRDLRSRTRLTRAEAQIGGYLSAKAESGGRYSGLLTDGAIWRLYRWGSAGLVFVDELTLTPGRIDDRRFRWWLGAVLATERQLLPTAEALAERLGAEAPSYALVRAALLECWSHSGRAPVVAVKRDLWSKLLHSALGSQFRDTDELFIEHTYLVLLATLIAHAVIGFELAAHEPGVLLSGQLFEHAGILGVGEAGFFDWVLDAPGGAEIVSDIARRVGAFRWRDDAINVDHDVLKALYQSVITASVRRQLGEYYTPDWLATRMVNEVVTDPLQQRVLDPACGSGTFVFHAVQRYLDAASAAHVPTSTALQDLSKSVFGVDLHPVAVALAQTTYLLAIGPERLEERKDTLSVPIYLGDSMRWEAADEDMFNAAGDIVLYTADSTQLFASELRFPAAVVADVGRFDHLVNDLVERASGRRPRGPRPNIDGLLKSLALAAEDQAAVKTTYSVLCDLHDEGRNHIWGFYIRNQSRPTWLARPENRVDVLIGNPPWLAYRNMPQPLQEIYQRRARERNLWLGGARGRTTQQDLSAFFVARAVELYLRDGGRFAFVMPRAVLSRQTYAGFRAANFSNGGGECRVAFTTSWDLGRVRPHPFPVPSAVVFGSRSDQSRALPDDVLAWSGRAPSTGERGWLTSDESTVVAVTGEEVSSVYKRRFRQGAILVPRMLIMVTDAPATPLGVPQGRRAVRSRKTTLDKLPWRDLPAHEGVVESIFIRAAYLGESIAPFRVLTVREALIPYDGTRLMDGADDRIDRYPGLSAWWRQAEDIWMHNRTTDRRTLIEQLDYMRQLTAQFPIAPRRVVYTKAGNTLTAAVINDHLGVIDHKLYWAPVSSNEEARYLVAVLNAPALTVLVEPYQSVGAFGPRDFDKYVWQAPIPPFDPTNALHQRLVGLAARAEEVAAQTDVTDARTFQVARRVIRYALNYTGIATELDDAVAQLLGQA